MKRVEVRCWKIECYRKGENQPDTLYVTYPEYNYGHKLITCLTCGHVYAVTILDEVYTGPSLDEKLKVINCITCNDPLHDNFAYYPETYVINGDKFAYERAIEIPDESLAIYKEFDAIYNK